MKRTAIIAGQGALPIMVSAAMKAQAVKARAMTVPAVDTLALVAALDGFQPDGLVPDMTFRIERLVPFLRDLEAAGVGRVVFAGAVQRPRLDPAMFDPDTATLVPRLLGAMQGGDDATLRVVIALFEEFGFAVAGIADVAPLLVPGVGVLAGQPSAQDEADAARAATIVAALGAVDVGQGAVVQQGLCLGVETLSGTDAMLAAVAALPPALRPARGKGRGLFYKAPKPGQDRRVDLPTIGPQTLRAVAAAGLGGIAWEAGGVICLDFPAMQAMATRDGLILWARAV
jgi:hypothetical protein